MAVLRPLLHRMPERLRGTLGLRRARRFVRGLVHVRHERARLRADAPELVFWPMRPDPKAALARILAHLGIRPARRLPGTSPTIAWETGTYLPLRAVAELPRHALNARCVDISKVLVDEAWVAAAGYGANVDPRAHNGPMVDKSNANGRHDGRIVQGPLAKPRPGRVYQLVIDNVDDGQAVDLRVIVVGNGLALVYRKSRPAGSRFSNLNRHVELCTPGETLSQAEQAQILELARLVGLDYGEIDTCRDRSSGRLYALDVNRTPAGPPNGLPPEHARRAVELMARPFAELLAARWPEEFAAVRRV